MFKDILGREIVEGCIVARAIYSGHTFHKVLRITDKGIVLSRGHRTIHYETRWYRSAVTGRFQHHETPTTQSFDVYSGGATIEDIDNHTGEIYLSQDKVSLVLAI